MIVNAESLRLPLRENSVHAAICSPPYWGGLRVYAGEQGREWPAIAYSPMPGLPPVEIPAQTVALGHEPDPFAFVGHLLQVFREVRRVLRPEAVLAVNLGDKYANGGNPSPGQTSTGLNVGNSTEWKAQHKAQGSAEVEGLASKNLLLMPWRLALAMQADGWILRSRMPGGADTEGGLEPDIVWKKAACMPESCRDRPTNDFEDVLVFSQRPGYFWDQEAVREAIGNGGERRSRKALSEGRASAFAGGVHRGQSGGTGKQFARPDNPAGRNMRAVWTINPEPTDEEHYAAWPVELASRLIRVTTSEKGCCPECGASWQRVVEREPAPAHVFTKRNAPGAGKVHSGGTVNGNMRGHGRKLWEWRKANPGVGRWQPACAHETEPAPCAVLDPFAGLGRTWEACKATGRRFVGADLGLEYCYLARSRNNAKAMERRRVSERGKTISGPLFVD